MKTIKEEKTKNDKEIQHFNPNKDMPKNFFCLVAGARRFGKTHQIRQICFEIHKNKKIGVFDYVCLVSKTAKIQTDAFPFIPPKERYDDINEGLEKIEELIDQQKKRKEKKQKLLRILVILDDIISEKGMMYDKRLLRFPILLRHFNISAFLLVQRIQKAIPKIFPENSDIIIFFKSISQNERQYIMENYLTILNTNDRKYVFDYYDKIFTQPFVSMVILKLKAMDSIDLFGYVKKYLASKEQPFLKNFKMGRDYFWRKRNNTEIKH
tara:strand:- start:1313 stop:2113 length:801 start_codon:yes stop_codon:yes gene_type:complete